MLVYQLVVFGPVKWHRRQCGYGVYFDMVLVSETVHQIINTLHYYPLEPKR